MLIQSSVWPVLTIESDWPRAASANRAMQQSRRIDEGRGWKSIKSVWIQ